MIQAVYYGEKDTTNFIPVDEWVPEPKDMIFKSCKGAIIIDSISRYYGSDSIAINQFILSTKRCYNGDEMRLHLPLYLNYFEKFYDTDKELLQVYCKLKYVIDYTENYSKEMFFNDLIRYVLSPSLQNKAHAMNEDNYTLELDNKKYQNDKNPSLIYKDKHAKVLMWISLMMNMCIPLLTHYIFINKLSNTNELLLEMFDIIMYIRSSEINIYNKLYETCRSNIYKNVKKNEVLWEMQSIRSKNVTTHTISSVNNIILNIIPKYTYNRNIIFFNYASIKQNSHYQVIGIQYEYDYISLSSSKRDAENNSIFDRFESYLIKQNEALYLQNKVNCQETMKKITQLYGPFSDDEINYYLERLQGDGGSDCIINSFQRTLIFNLFYKYFGDVESIKAINKIDYIKLMIAASRMLKANGMIILPYIISSKIEKLQHKKTMNKKEFNKLESSKYYDIIKDKYRNTKIELQILGIIATILSSEFSIIDYEDWDGVDGKSIPMISDYICEEVLMYITMI